MARIGEPTAQQEKIYREWIAGLPDAVKVIACRFDPWTLYRMKSTGHRVTVVSFSDDGTLRVAVLGRFNAILHELSVVGVDPDDLEECDLPDSDELVGAVLTQDEVVAHIDVLRVLVRPDLWVMGEDGVARRKNH